MVRKHKSTITLSRVTSCATIVVLGDGPYLEMVDNAEADDWPPRAVAGRPVVFSELLDDELDISPP